MEKNNYLDKVKYLLVTSFIPAGYKITKDVELSTIPEATKYDALNFSLNNQKIVYRKGKNTEDRPGAFLAIWKRPSSSIVNNKPIALESNEIDYLFVEVEEHSSIVSNEGSINDLRKGIFIFPVSILIAKGIISSEKKKGKTGFRVFPPWSEDKGVVGMKVFSQSGKKTQCWQLPYYIEINKDGSIDSFKLDKIFNA